MRIYQVDAFTREIFKGNPAGVCVLPPERMNDAVLLQNIAAEMNLSETAFLAKQGNEYRLRWFTPTTEVSFCGHATLSSAHVLWETGAEKRQDTIQFDTLSGILFARFKTDKVELDFPTFGTEEIAPQKEMNAALGINPIFTGTSRKRYLFEVDSIDTLRAIHPDFGKLAQFESKSFVVTCKSDRPEYDFYSRFFAPGHGINEDPVTGSSHSTLAPYWGRKLGKNHLVGYQASKRGGTLECELTSNGRVLISGSAVTVFVIDTKFD